MNINMANPENRSDAFSVEYLGSAMLAQMSTGLGVLQKPLRDMYFRFRQASARAPVRLQERQLMMTEQGMTVSYPGATPGSGQNNNGSLVQEFYAMPSILSWDAVRFVAVKAHDKKIRSAFEPLDNDHSRNKDNLFSQLDKPFHFLAQQRHPPLFTCVLRRTQGLKALDVHAFICHSDEEALGLVRTLNIVHSSYISEEQQETGVFGYNPFGKESVRSTAGLQKALLQSGGDRGDPRLSGQEPEVQHQFILRRPGETAGNLPNRGGTPRASPSPAQKRGVYDRSNNVASPLGNPPTDINLYTQSQPNLSVVAAATPESQAIRGPGKQSQSRAKQSQQQAGDRNSRVFLLSQDDFALQKSPERNHSRNVDNEHKKKQSKSKNNKDNSEETYDYLQHINRTLERQQPMTPKTQVSPSVFTSPDDSLRGYPKAYGSISNAFEINDDTLRSQLSFRGGGIFMEDKPNPDDKRQSKTKQNMGQGYSLLSSSQGPPPGYAPHQNSRNPYAPSPGLHGNERTPSPTYEPQITGNRDRPEQVSHGDNGRQFDGRQYGARQMTSGANDARESSTLTRKEQLGRSGPAVYPIPMIPPRSPVLNKKESIRRDMNISPETRPSTRQGTVMAQVTPQSQRNSNVGPFGNRQSLVMSDKDRAMSAASTPNLRGDDDGLPSNRNNMSQMVPHSRPVAMVQPHKIQGVKVLPSQPSLPRQLTKPSEVVKSQNTDANSQKRSPDIIRRNRPNSVYMDNNDSLKAPVRNAKSQYFGSESVGYTIADSVQSPTSNVTDIYAYPKKGPKSKQKNDIKPKTETTTNWQFHKPTSKSESSMNRTNAAGEAGEHSEDNSLLVNQKKDAEIASVMQHMNFEYEGTMSPHAPHRTNFEKSLGYFP